MKHKPQGIGIYVWAIKNLPKNWVAEFLAMGFTWIAVKIADGVNSYNLRPLPDGGYADDILDPFIGLARSAGFQVYGWQYIWGFNPVDEAEKAVKRMRKFDLDGFIIDAENQYKNKSAQAALYSKTLRDLLPDKSIALSTYRFPELHREFPYTMFLKVCDWNAPQVYWNPGKAGKELRECNLQYSKITDLPLIPTGRAYVGNGFPKPTPGEIVDFLDTARALDCSGAFFWSADSLYHRLVPLPEIVKAIKEYTWEISPLEPDPLEPDFVFMRELAINVNGNIYLNENEIQLVKKE